MHSAESAVAPLQAPRGASRRRPFPRIAANPWTALVYGAMAVWTVALATLVRAEYLGYRFGRFDLGDMTQAVWSTAHGRPLEVTTAAGDQTVRLGSHVDPVLTLLAPLWLVWGSPLTIAFIQVAAVALGALPVYWLGRNYLGSEATAGLLALAYLAYPWLAWTALDALHPVTFAIPLLLYCVWFLESDRLDRFAVCAIVAAATGELMGLTIAALGVWFAFAHHRRRAGAVIAAAGVLWSAFAVEMIGPIFAGGATGPNGNYESIGGSPQGVIGTLFTHPGAIAAALLTSHHLLYLAWLSVPLAGSFLLAPSLAAVALPQLLANGLSDTTSMTDPRLHYIAAVTPFLIAASVVGLARLRSDLRTPTAAFVLVLCASFSAIIGAWPGAAANASPAGRAGPTKAHVHALDAAVALVPADAAVSATNDVGSHLSARREFYSVPVVGGADWIVVDTTDPVLWHASGSVLVFSPDRAKLRAFTARIERSSSWVPVYDREGVLVFRKASPA